MTKLDSTQTELLERLAAAKKSFDEWDENLTREVAATRSAAKEGLRQLVSEALGLRIPMRQIHLHGMGMNQVGQMTSFLDGRNNRDGLAAILTGQASGASALPAALSTEVAPQPQIRKGNGVAKWTKADGTEDKITRVDSGAGFYYIPEDEWNYLSVAEQAMFRADAKTLCGDEEYAAYMQDQIEPAHWAAFIE